MDFNLARLRYLYEVALCGSMRAASEKVNVSPSSVSRQIAILEQELGVAVLERGRSKAKLTEAGEMVVEYYREDLARKETLASHLDEIRGLRRGVVKIATGEGFVSDLLSESISAFEAAYPGVKLEVVVAGTNQILSSVESDEAHVGMVFDSPSAPRIATQQTYQLPLKAVMSPRNPLAKKESLRFKDLDGEKYALPPKNFRIREVMEQAAAKENFVLTPTLTSNSLMILKNSAMAPDTVTILPDLAVFKELKAGLLVSMPVESKGLSGTTAGIVTRSGRLLPVSAKAFLTYLRRYFQNELR
ncbi:MAG: LysR family transcriptional regulator [Parvularculaceae bacterium]|nr:LysR family transcriptional regulator [Parvularculaceae bacterium]